MKLESLKIEYNRWGENKDKYTAVIKYDDDRGSLELKLSPALSEELLKFTGDAIAKYSQYASEELKTNIMISVAEVNKTIEMGGEAMNKYKEPELTIVVLDFLKEDETRVCLESIKRHVKFPVKVIYYHNGNGAEYPYKFFKDGLCDMLIQTRKNEGLGIGTRDTFRAVQSRYVLSIQNDQFIGRDFTQDEFENIKKYINSKVGLRTLKSISLAGAVCGEWIYSERAHIMETSFYDWMENVIPLGYYGAGPYHDGEWREGQIQKFYKYNEYIHLTSWPQLVVDNGRSAKRQNPDGSLWEHRPDTKGLRLISGPVTQRNIYPYFTPVEWDYVLTNQSWPEWAIPEKEKPHSFHVWN